MHHKTVFIVEDDQDIRDVIFLILSGNGYKVNMYGSAAAVKQQMSTQLPDLIVLDIRLPDGDGVQICKEIKKDPVTSHIPVILMSANNYEEVSAKSADAYIGKPFDISVFRALIEKLLLN